MCLLKLYDIAIQLSTCNYMYYNGDCLSTSICIRVPDDMNHKLHSLAQTLERPRSYIIKKALDKYLEEYADYLIAIDRLHDKDDTIISSKQLRDQLGL